ncbi:hypothetical protein DPMN_130887 [Dreissena polymorpha]|uniref:Uncharacterized protein n=1 Tax=Dreissena polymorpha TaxID=45954 RepID=A0A9D4HBU3_DREPO|nr:hypothetical protein DPMN_130887 [Dreissena polymorpha]
MLRMRPCHTTCCTSIEFATLTTAPPPSPLRVQYRNCRNTTTGTDQAHFLQPEGEAVQRNATRSSSVVSHGTSMDT